MFLEERIETNKFVNSFQFCGFDTSFSSFRTTQPPSKKVSVLKQKSCLKNIRQLFYYDRKDSLVVISLVIVVFFIHIEIHQKIKTL